MLKQVPPQADTATCCSAASCNNTRSDLKAQPHHPNAAPELTNSVPKHRKLSWSWLCVGSTTLFLAPKPSSFSLHHTLIHSCSRNIMNGTQICHKIIQVVQPRVEFKDLTLSSKKCMHLAMSADGTILHHFCLFHVQWQIISALNPCRVLKRKKN